MNLSSLSASKCRPKSAGTGQKISTDSPWSGLDIQAICLARLVDNFDKDD